MRFLCRPLILWVALLLLLASGPATAQEVRWALALHGGAGARPADFTPEEREAYERSLGAALDAGCAVLAQGGTSLEAVEAVVVLLEDDPLFNAGRGAVLNSEGGHELDASIMDGKTLACGAVAGVRTVKNPISLATLVMQKTRHILLAGPGAEQFADEMDVERVEQAYFRTEKAQRSWETARKRQHGTVGCVALDGQGNLAAATSTGGLTNKRFGRIGDSPIIGAGTYADNATCAVSCTGIGEQFIRHSVAFQVSARVAWGGLTLREAVDQVLNSVLSPDDGGIIAVDRQGVVVTDFNTPGMLRAWADSRGRREIGAGPREKLTAPQKS